MMDQLFSRSAGMDRLFQCVLDKLRVLRRRCLPVHDPIGKGINDKRDKDEPSPSGHEREVGERTL